MAAFTTISKDTPLPTTHPIRIRTSISRHTISHHTLFAFSHIAIWLLSSAAIVSRIPLQSDNISLLNQTPLRPSLVLSPALAQDQYLARSISTALFARLGLIVVVAGAAIYPLSYISSQLGILLVILARGYISSISASVSASASAPARSGNGDDSGSVEGNENTYISTDEKRKSKQDTAQRIRAARQIATNEDEDGLARLAQTRV